MRIVGAVLVVLLASLSAAAQYDTPTSPQPGISSRPTAQVHKFRRSSVRAAMRARRATLSRRGQAAAEGGSAEQRAMAARRRRLAPVAPPADTLSVADRMTMQFDLAWISEFNGLINGELNSRTTAAIRSFQRNHKFRETGVLNTQERAVLAALAKAKQAQVGWSMIDDAVTGARIGLPTRQVPIKSQSKSGSRWSSTQGQVQIETFKLNEPGTTLASVYERQKKEPAGRRLDANVLQPSAFVLSGVQGQKNFFVRAEFKDGEVRGMTVLYDQASEPLMDPVAVVMSNTFTAFPGAAPAAAAQVATQPRRKVEYGSGIIVSAAGHILTDRQLTDGCNVIVVSGYGDADRRADDKAADLALLRVYGAPDLAPAAFVGDSARGGDVTLIGVADPQAQGGGGAVSTTTARLRGDVIDPPPQPGFSGAAALDSQGRIAGLVALKPAVVAAVDAAEARPQATMVPAATIRAFLEGQKLAPAAGRTGADATMASVVRVICVRK